MTQQVKDTIKDVLDLRGRQNLIKHPMHGCSPFYNLFYESAGGTTQGIPVRLPQACVGRTVRYQLSHDSYKLRKHSFLMLGVLLTEAIEFNQKGLLLGLQVGGKGGTDMWEEHKYQSQTLGGQCQVLCCYAS